MYWSSIASVGDLDMALVGSVCSIVGLVLGFVAGWGWWRVRKLIRRDREANINPLDLYETYRHLERAEQILTERILESAATPEEKKHILEVRDGLVGSRRSLNVAFFLVHDHKVTRSDSLVKVAKWHRSRRCLTLATICYELALQNSRDGAELSAEDRRACLFGLQQCSIALGDREEAGRWAREATEKNVPGCFSEQDLERWFCLRRLFVLTRLLALDPLLRSRRPPGPGGGLLAP